MKEFLLDLNFTVDSVFEVTKEFTIYWVILQKNNYGVQIFKFILYYYKRVKKL